MTGASEFFNLPEKLEAFGARTAIVLGSGLNSFADALEIEDTIPYESIPGLPAFKVPGHAGAFLLQHILPCKFH